MLRRTEVVAVLAILVFAGTLWAAKQQKTKSERQADRIAITNYVSSLTNIQSMNITNIRRLDQNTVEVMTGAKDDKGGDILTLKKQNSGWQLSQKGVWFQ